MKIFVFNKGRGKPPHPLLKFYRRAEEEHFLVRK